MEDSIHGGESRAEDLKGIRRACSQQADARRAVREFHAAVAQPEMALVLFYCSCTYDLEALASEMHELFGSVPVVGCTTAGEVGPEGLLDKALVGVSFSTAEFTAEVGWQDSLDQFDPEQGREFARHLREELGHRVAPLSGSNCFGIVLLDGLSSNVESVARVWQQVLGSIQLVGGAAAGGMNYQCTHVYAAGNFRKERAVCALLATDLPFVLRKTQHFVPTDERMVITAADPEKRMIFEINGLPAAEEYARMVGVPVESLSPVVFAAWPVVVLISGNHYVRSIKSANPDGSMTLMCAIERGVVLRLARGVDLVENLEANFAEIREQVGEPLLTLGFDCMLRRVEVERLGLVNQISEVLMRNRTVGFCTYGEQLRGIHINQTFTCAVIGTQRLEAGHE